MGGAFFKIIKASALDICFAEINFLANNKVYRIAFYGCKLGKRAIKQVNYCYGD
jgi:hypothetical protein